MSIIDLEVAFKSNITLGTTIVVCFSLVVLVILSWPVLFVIIPMMYLTTLLQVLANGSTNIKSLVIFHKRNFTIDFFFLCLFFIDK